MNDRFRAPTIEWTLYAALCLGALALRFWHLGAHPLTDEEAREALTVLARLRGEATAAALPASPAYFAWTFWHFFLFGASEAAARAAPALAGAGLVLLPAFFRPVLGRGAALVVAGLLAVSSTLLAASRSVDGALLALVGLSLGLGSLYHVARGGHRAWLIVASAGFALALASGGDFLIGALALVLTLLILRLTQPEGLAGLRAHPVALPDFRRPLLVGVALGTLVIATVGGLYLRGLGALVASWTTWLGGWVPTAPGRSPQVLPLFVASYEPLLLVFGLIGVVLALRRGHRLMQALAWFSLVSFALAVFYTARSMSDIVWLAAALAVLAGWAIYTLVAEAWAAHEWPLVVAQTAIGFALAMFALLNVAAFAESTRGGRTPPNLLQTVFLGRTITVGAGTQLIIAVLAVALVLVVAYLFALGWSERASRVGLALTAVAVLLPATLSGGWGATQFRPGQAGELWWPKPASVDVWRLMDTLGDVSNYNVGNTHDIEVTVQAADRGALRWQLRDFPNAVFVDRLGPQMISPVVITPINEDNPTLGSSYVGQDFDLNNAWVPPATFADWVNWAAFRRTTSLHAEPVILWVRQDVQELTSTGE